MYMSLQDLRDKLVADSTFTQQFVKDAAEVGVNVNILKSTGEIDNELLEGNTNLLNTYVNVVQRIINQKPAGATRRLASYIHAPFYREEDFAFDPDTRLITVPAAFNKNGVAVVGDHLAELLFFKTPRFFDVVDLFNCEIYVYWHNTGLKDYSEPHISIPIAVYPEGDVLHFGWYLDENATGVAGQIEFSLEFVIKDATSGEVTFRLYSQPAKITVKNSIDMDAAGVVPEDRESLIYSRAIYSNVVNLLTAAPAVITKNLPTGDLNLDEETGTITLNVEAMIPAEERETNNLIYGWNWNGVMVEQPSGSTINDKEHLIGITTYELDSKDEDGNEIKIAVFSDPIETVGGGEVTYTYDAADMENIANPAEAGLYELVEGEYIVTEDATVNSEKTYYVRSEHTSAGSAKEGTTYKTLTTNVPGQYQVYVGNVVTDPASENYGGIRYVYSHVAQIASASAIDIVPTDMPSVTYFDNWQNRSPVMTAQITGANGKVMCDWYHQSPTGEVTLLKTVQADEVLNEGVATGVYSTTYDPSANGTETTNADLRGYYFVEARNIKNNTVERDTSKKCFVEVMPIKIPAIKLEVINAGDHVFKVTVPQPQHNALMYELTASVRSYYVANGEEHVKETPVYFDNLSTYKYFNSGADNGEIAFQLSDATIAKAGLKENDPYILFVGVVPIAQYKVPGLERYATKFDASSNTELPDRTYTQSEPLTF